MDRDKVIGILEKKVNGIKTTWDKMSKFEGRHFIEPGQEVLADFIGDYANYRINSSIEYFERLIKHMAYYETADVKRIPPPFPPLRFLLSIVAHL